MSMFSFQAIHNWELDYWQRWLVVYRLCQCSLFKQFTTSSGGSTIASRCLSIMSMFSFQAIHNVPPADAASESLFIDYVNVLFSSNSQHKRDRKINKDGCLSIMSMFSFQAIHNEPSRFIFRCKGTIFFGQCQIYFSRGWKINTLLFNTHEGMEVSGCLSIMSISLKFKEYNQSLMQPSNVVIYSIVIRSFSYRFPFHKGRNEGNISENDMMKNDATSSPEGTQRNVGDKYATLSERWGKMA